MNLMSLIPISFTSYAIMKRKKVIWALIPNLPYFLCAVALVYRVPDQLPCEVFLTAVILLLIVHISRSRNTTLSDRTILKLSLPLLIFILSLGAIYPQKGYKKDELANIYKGKGTQKEKELVYDILFSIKALRLNLVFICIVY